MHERFLVRLYPCLRRELAFFPSQTGVPNEVRRRLRRREMEDVVVFGECRSSFGVQEVCTLRRRVDAGQTASYGYGNFTLLVYFF